MWEETQARGSAVCRHRGLCPTSGRRSHRWGCRFCFSPHPQPLVPMLIPLLSWPIPSCCPHTSHGGPLACKLAPPLELLLTLSLECIRINSQGPAIDHPTRPLLGDDASSHSPVATPGSYPKDKAYKLATSIRDKIQETMPEEAVEAAEAPQQLSSVLSDPIERVSRRWMLRLAHLPVWEKAKERDRQDGCGGGLQVKGRGGGRRRDWVGTP